MHFTSFLENGKMTVVLTGEIDHHCAKKYIQGALAANLDLGKGQGPMNHAYGINTDYLNLE